MGIGEKGTFVLKNLREYSGRNVKDKLLYGKKFAKSGVTNWSELPAEHKSDKGILIFLLILLEIMLMVLIYWASSPTSTNQMENSSASIGRNLGSGIFSLRLSSNFPNVQFLNTLESLDKP